MILISNLSILYNLIQFGPPYLSSVIVEIVNSNEFSENCLSDASVYNYYRMRRVKIRLHWICPSTIGSQVIWDHIYSMILFGVHSREMYIRVSGLSKKKNKPSLLCVLVRSAGGHMSVASTRRGRRCRCHSHIHIYDTSFDVCDKTWVTGGVHIELQERAARFIVNTKPAPRTFSRCASCVLALRVHFLCRDARRRVQLVALGLCTIV